MGALRESPLRRLRRHLSQRERLGALLSLANLQAPFGAAFKQPLSHFLAKMTAPLTNGRLSFFTTYKRSIFDLISI